MSDHPTVQRVAAFISKQTRGSDVIWDEDQRLAEVLAAAGLLADRSWEGEHCQACGKPFDDVYWLPDHIWRRITIDPDRPDAGLPCPSCALTRIITSGLLAGPTPALTPERADVIEAAITWRQSTWRHSSATRLALAVDRLAAATDRNEP